jgi:citrate synthase
MDRITRLGGKLKAKNTKETSTLTVTDNRTGKVYTLPIYNNSFFDCENFLEIKDRDGKLLRSYDPGYTNTMSCTSEITFIDGGKGILQYRGIPIEQLAEKSSFLEVAYLLINGNLPNAQQLEIWENKINKHSCLNQDLGELMKQFRYDAHPMGMLISTMAAYSTLHPEANPALSGQGIYKNEGLVNKQIYRIVGTITTICANAYRSRIGRDFNLPDNKLNYVENFLAMLDRLGNEKLKPHPTIARAMNILFILHADHEQNCSTAAIRHLTSSGVDVYSAISGAIAALYGPSHGGANEAVIRMLEEIGSVDKIPEFIKDVKDKKRRLMGFGHRVYKNYDPRARIIKRVAEEVFEVVGKEPLIEIAVKLEEIALSDEYFIKKKLYPNVDFYSGIIYKALGFPTDMFPVLFTIPRVVGWLAHWKEFINDPDFKIVRPRQNYVGELNKNYVEIENRPFINVNLDCPSSAVSKRREKSLIE